MLGLGAASFAGATLALGGTLFGTLSAKERPVSAADDARTRGDAAGEDAARSEGPSASENGNPPGAAPQNGKPATARQNGNPLGAASENGNPLGAAPQNANPPTARQNGHPLGAAPQNANPPTARQNGNPLGAASENGHPRSAPSENGNPQTAHRPSGTDPSAASTSSRPNGRSRQGADGRAAKGVRARSGQLSSLDGDVRLERSGTSASVEPLAADGALARTTTGCPEGMVRAGRACVDAYEAHLEVLAADGAYVPWPHQLRPPSHGRYRAAVTAAMPQAYVSREEASRACHNASKRLCRLSEWKRACRGGKPTTFPYGNRERRGRCNTGKPHLLTELFGPDNRGWEYDRHFNAPELSLLAGYLTKGGTFNGCTTREGTFDMVGNLHEWVEDRVTSGLMRRLREESIYREPQPWHVGNGIFVGGFYSTKSEHGPGCHFITVAHGASYHDYSTGFRCCVDGADAAPPLGASP